MLNAPQFLSRAGARSSLYSRGDALAMVMRLPPYCRDASARRNDLERRHDFAPREQALGRPFRKQLPHVCMTKPLGKADSGFAHSRKLTKWPWFSLRSIAKVKGKFIGASVADDARSRDFGLG